MFVKLNRQKREVVSSMDSGLSSFFTTPVNISDTLFSCLLSTMPDMNSRLVLSTKPSLPSVLPLFLGTSEERLNKTLHLYLPQVMLSNLSLFSSSFIHSVAVKGVS